MKKHMPEGDQIMAPFFSPTASEVSFNSETLQAEAPYGKQDFSDLSSHLLSTEQVSYVHSVAFERLWTTELRQRVVCF